MLGARGAVELDQSVLCCNAGGYRCRRWVCGHERVKEFQRKNEKKERKKPQKTSSLKRIWSTSFQNITNKEKKEKKKESFENVSEKET